MPDIIVILVTTEKERCAAIRSYGDIHRMFRNAHPLLLPTIAHHPTFKGLPLEVKPNFDTYVALAAMEVPGYTAFTI